MLSDDEIELIAGRVAEILAEEGVHLARDRWNSDTICAAVLGTDHTGTSRSGSVRWYLHRILECVYNIPAPEHEHHLGVMVNDETAVLLDQVLDEIEQATR